MTEETLETIILGHIAKELKDEIQIGRQINLAKAITQALRIHDVVGRSELLLAFIEHIKKDNELTETVNANDVEAFIKSQQ